MSAEYKYKPINWHYSVRNKRSHNELEVNSVPGAGTVVQPGRGKAQGCGHLPGGVTKPGTWS